MTVCSFCRAVVAYVHLMCGAEAKVAPLGAREADAICMELGKQGKGAAGAAPVPNLSGRMGQPLAMGESPPTEKSQPPEDPLMASQPPSLAQEVSQTPQKARIFLFSCYWEV